MEPGNESPDREMLLAEFQALRTEILQRNSTQWNIFALQLTAAAVVFSFALSSSSHTGFLLVLPVVTYALSGRYVSQSLGIYKIAQYIRDVLEPRAKGQLQWETWAKQHPRANRTLKWANPLYLTFPGVASVALVWVAPYVWTSQHASVGARILLIVIWVIGIAVTVLSFQIITSRHWLPASWKQEIRFDRLSVAGNGAGDGQSNIDNQHPDPASAPRADPN
jgi:hypothetical protein